MNDEHAATIYHDLMCRENHADACGWYYEKGWDEYAHAQALEAVQRAKKFGRLDIFIKQLEAAKKRS